MMKKIACFLMLLVMMALIVPYAAFSEELSLIYRDDVTVYAWITELPYDVEALFAQLPTLDEAKKAAKKWEAGSQHGFYPELDGVTYSGLVWYDEGEGGDGHVTSVELTFRKDGEWSESLHIYPDPSYPYPSEAVQYTLARMEMRDGEWMSIPLVRGYYNLDGRLTGYWYYPVEGEAELRMDGYGAPELYWWNISEERVAQVSEEYGFPRVTGDLYNYDNVTNMMPEFPLYEAFADLGVDLPGLIAEPTEDVYITRDGDVLTEVIISFQEPLAGVYNELDLQLNSEVLLLYSANGTAVYSLDGRLWYYEYSAWDGTLVTCGPDGELWDPLDIDERRLAQYKPLPVMPASSQEVFAADVLGRLRATSDTGAVYATLADGPVDLTPLLATAKSPWPGEASDTTVTLPDEGYSWTEVSVYDEAADEYLNESGELSGGVWTIPIPALPGDDAAELTVSAGWYDADGNYCVISWAYPSGGTGYYAMFPAADENGFVELDVENGRFEGLYMVQLLGEFATATYDMDGVLLRYVYETLDGVRAEYTAAGELTFITEGADQTQYPPLTILE